MTPSEVQENEIAAFFKWREQLSLLEENRTVTISPYEKNIEYWRQLWRVVEFSDLLIQIVDARNPLLFFSRDLVKYVQEIAQQQKRKKQTFLILNKADFVPLNIRERWSNYFREKGIKHCFYSALREEAIIKYLFNQNKLFNDQGTDLEQQLRNEGITSENVERDDNEQQQNIDEQKEDELDKQEVELKEKLKTMSRYEIEQNKRLLKREKRQIARANQRKQQNEIGTMINNNTLQIPDVVVKIDDQDVEFDIEGSPKIVSRQQLVQIITSFKGTIEADPKRLFCVGTIGFPNIGKSSIINTLSIQTGIKTAVGETPGKTKHFQTIQMPDFTLCDCPGLVFPCFSHCRADFVLNGVLPVDKERDYISYLSLLCKRIPARVFNKLYALEIRENTDKFETGVGLTYGSKARETGRDYYCTYQELLDEFEAKLGINFGVVGKKLVKDLFCGKLLYIALPPSGKQVKITKQDDKEFIQQKMEDIKQKMEEEALMNMDEACEEEFEEEDFAE